MRKLLMGLLSLLAVAVASAQQYELVVLDQSTNESGAYGINSYGFTVGYKMQDGVSTPCIWSPSRGSLELTRFPNLYIATVGCAYAIGDNFVIAGTYGYWNSSVDEFHLNEGSAGYWYFDGTDFVASNIGSGYTAARGVNNYGKVAGWNFMAWGYHYSFAITDTDANATSTGYLESRTFSINDSNNACGDYVDWIYGGLASPCFFQKQSNGYYSYVPNTSLRGSCGISINNSNEIVGYGTTQGFYWNPDAGATVLFGAATKCYAINDAGTIVGTTNNRACMWKKSQGVYSVIDLNSLVTSTPGYILERAFSVSSKDQIVGQCLNTNTGTRSAFMLTPAIPALQAMQKGTNGLELRWIGAVDHTYSFRTSTDLVTWESLPYLYTADDTNAWVTLDPDEEKRFFRVLDLTP